MQEAKQAKLRLKLAFSPKLKEDRRDVLNKIKQRAILTICSKNSVKLIAKKCLFPQSELLKMQYTAEKISEGRANKTIDVEVFCGLKMFNVDGNKNKTIFIRMLMIKVITSPAETVE